MFRCPGQDQRFWKPEDIFEVKCPGCGQTKEFFKDEPKLKCSNCGQVVINPKIDLGCAQWCQYAQQCLGAVVEDRAEVIQNRLIEQMRGVFGDDRKRIDHTLAVLDYARQIQAVEGGNPLVVKAAAILHDIGIVQARQKHGSPAARFQEIEGPIAAKEILTRLNLDNATVEHVCRIIANHRSAKDIDTIEFRIVWDADWLVNIQAEFANAGKAELREIINEKFKTSKGHQMATELFLLYFSVL